MRIGMILDGPFPPDPRVENEALTLVGGGHQVSLFCLDYEGNGPERESVDGIQVHRIPAPRRVRSFSALAYTLPIYHRYLEPRIASFVDATGSEALHVHDMQSAGAVFRVNEQRGLPLVLDLHENRPEIMRHYAHVRSLAGRVLIRPSVWRSHERMFLQRADRVVVVTEEAKQHYLEHEPALSSETFVVVPNTVRRAFFEEYAVDESVLARHRDRFTVLYLGDTGLRRGLLTAIEATARLAPTIPELELVIVGESRTDRVLRARVAELGLERRVQFEGWRDFSLFPSYILACDVGLSPLHRNVHHDTTFANKVFQYMSFGRPIVASDCTAQANLVRRIECGLVFEDRNVADLAEKIERLRRDTEERERLGAKGREAVETTWNWEETSRGLVDLYESWNGRLS